MLLVMLMLAFSANAINITGKQIYVPKELQNMNLNDTASEWCYSRMTLTPNIAIFWEKGFGDMTNPPALDGHKMDVNLSNLKSKLESFYTFFKDTLQFIKPGSNADKYRMMTMLRYSLEGTAYGGDYDSIIGALWIAPNRIQDEKLNCIAHELGHSFQSQITCDGLSHSWDCGGFYEMTSQWMLWQVNPQWMTDENYHWVAFTKQTHKAFMHNDNIYHSPYILEYWGMKHGRPFIADMYRQGHADEDVVMTYQRMTKINQRQFCDEMFDAVRHIVNLDYPRVWRYTRNYACTLSARLHAEKHGWYAIDDDNAPENYGFNAIPLVVPKMGKTVKVKFRGLAGKNVSAQQAPSAGWRYGFVCVTLHGESIYSAMMDKSDGTLTFTLPKDKSVLHLYLVVMGAPAVHWRNPDKGSDAQWPYMIKLSGTDIIAPAQNNQNKQ